MKILICGPCSSGKTTLFNALVKESHIVNKLPQIKEIARSIITQRKLNQKDLQDKEIFFEFQKELVQKRAEIEANHDSFISDRSALDAVVYVLEMFPEYNLRDLYAHMPLLKDCINRYRNSLFLLIHPLEHFVDDGVRRVDSYDRRKQYTAMYSKLLDDLGISYLEIRTVDHQARLNEIKEAIAGKQELKCVHLDTNKPSARNRRNNSSSESAIPLHNVNFPFYLLDVRNDAIKIPKIQISPVSFEMSWVEFPQGKSNRFLDFKGNVTDLFIFEFLPRVRSKVAQNLLLNGVRINGDVYNFLGCSSSGLKQRKCYLYRGTREDCDQLINSAGNFRCFKNVSKKLARVGLLFSEVFLSRVTAKNIIEEEDIERNGKVFTDGCGSISESLAKKIFSKIKENKNVFKISEDFPLPSVLQIRLQGFKGVVAIDKCLSNDEILIRPSMIKFKTDRFPEIGICDFSKPNTFGNLNKQFIALLSGLGISNAVFIKKQEENFHLIKNMLSDPDAATKILLWHNEFSAVNHLVRLDLHENNLNNGLLKKKLLSIQSKLVQSAERLRLLIVKSRTLFGICDPYQILNYGQCFLRLTVDGEVQTLSGKVVVGKNPSYLLSDVRVLEAVDEVAVPELSKLSHLHDCIIFPTKGKRPHPDEIAGSDLDGDMYFVSWDSDLIPKSIRPPFAYPSAPSKPEGTIDFASQVKYFSEQNQIPLSLVDKLYWCWADKKGVDSSECERLGQIFSRTVDSAKSGEKITIPKTLSQILQDTTSADENQNSCIFVWRKLLTEARKFMDSMKEPISRDVERMECGISYSCIANIIQEHISNLTEFQKFDLGWNYFLKKNVPEQFAALEVIEHFGSDLNFSLFSNIEKKIAVDRGVPSSLIYNALNKSMIVSPVLLKKWDMINSVYTWHLINQKLSGGFDWNILLKVLSTHANTMLILQLPDEVKMIFQFNQRFIVGESCQSVNPGSIAALFFSEHFSIAKRCILGDSYLLDLTEDRLQLYEGNPDNTFVWLKFSDQINANNDEPDYVISVALNRFDKKIHSAIQHPKVRRVTFEKIELFVAEKPSFFCIESNTVPNVPEDFPEGETDTEIVDTSLFILKATTVMNQVEASLLYRLSEVCANIGSDEVPCEIINQIEISIVNFQPDTIGEIVNLICVLHRLKLDNLASQSIGLLQSRKISVKTLIDLVSKWYIFWFLDKNSSNALINTLSTLAHDEECNDALHYIKQYTLLLALDFVEELETTKDNLSLSLMKNLKVDCHPDETSDNDEKIIPFYSTSLIESLGDFKPGQMVAIFRQKASTSFRMTLCVGEIISIRQCPLSIAVKIQDDSIPVYLKYCLQSPRSVYFQLCLVGNVVGYSRCMEALLCLCDFEQPRTSLLTLLSNPLGHCINSPLYKPGKLSLKQQSFDEAYNSENLNHSQIEAVISTFKEDICLIQGPPGTGKTTVACEIVRFAHKLNIFNGILVCAETNLAVDNIARKLSLADTLTILRIGNTENVGDDLFDITLDGQLKRTSQLKSKSSTFTDKQGITHRDSKLVDKIIKSSDVVLTTCSGAGDPILKGFKFEFVLCDEATQSIEPVLLCALVHGSKKLVLIGDSNQIGPFSRKSKTSGGDCSTGLPNIELLTDTLFHRLQQRDYPVHLLNIQYRMHPFIMKFPSDHFYNGALLSGVKNSDRPPPAHFEWPAKNCPIAFISSKNDGEERKKSSYKNNDECCKIVHCVEKLLSPGCDLMQSDIGVITPYRGQVMAIKEKLSKKYQNVEVKTVDGFQGREKEVILVSMVRSNRGLNLGFIDDDRRTNVLLTRARRGLIVVGNRATLSNSPLWKSWMDNVPEYKSS